MSHLNYFLPYNKGTDNHEDHLTRAFLILLKYSNSVLQQFYSYVFQQLNLQFIDSIKPLHQSALTEISFETQVGSLPVADTYISILITNEHVSISQKIIPIERIAVYDGVIDFNSELVMFIETKPIKDNVWEQQLCPSKKDIPEEAVLVNKVAVLEWKEIINFLHRINESNITMPYEKILINDFFELVNQTFDYLNPYNDFSKCHSTYLANKRIEQILKEIAIDSDKAKHHSGWGFFIELDFPEIKKIALLLNLDEKGNWNGLSVVADFGSTVSQAREFYQNISSVKILEKIDDNWDISCDFHLSAYRVGNLVFLQSPENSLEKYFNYWKSNPWENFGGILKENLEEDYLKEYVEEGIVIYDEKKKEEVKNTILKKGYQRVNICPAIYFEHFISKEEATKLDKVGKLVPHITTKMKEVLGILNYPLDTILL